MRKIFSNEPLLDFQDEAVRSKMLKALNDVANQLGREYPLVMRAKDLYGKQDHFPGSFPEGRDCRICVQSVQRTG